MSLIKSNDVDRIPHQFVEDGPARFSKGIRPEIQQEVEDEFSERLDQASWFARPWIRWEIQREVQRRMSEQTPSEQTLW